MSAGSVMEAGSAGARVASPRRVGAERGRPEILASAVALEVRLAAGSGDIRGAQRLRYEVFFEKGGAVADPSVRSARRDVCRFDEVCEHLIVVDKSAPRFEGAPMVVGACRLLRQDIAERYFGFYSAREFDVDSLISRHPDKRFLELGRSCVAENYRGKRALELLWRGIWAYGLRHRVDVLFGCASLPGADPHKHAAALGFLQAAGTVDPVWTVDAPAGVIIAAPRSRVTERALPPLVKGYWRLGAKFSREVVVDTAFGTTDVFVVLPVEAITARYLDHFAPRA